MKKLSLGEIRGSSTEAIELGLRRREFSLLQSLGCHKLRAEMNLTGFVCRTIVFFAGLSRRRRSKDAGWPLTAQRRIGGLLRKVAPVEVVGDFPHPEHGMALGFNHPSLGEILRFIHISINTYGYRRNLYPVNLPWYEALMPIVDILEACDIYIMPIITPSTKSKMAKALDGERMEIVKTLANGFNARYIKACGEFAKSGDNIWLAPSATRQRSVFKNDACCNGTENIEPQTMSLLASSVARTKVEAFDFYPVAAVPPRNFGRGLNLFKTYQVTFGKPIPITTAKEKVRERKFEHLFLTEIAHMLIGMHASYLILPDNTDDGTKPSA